MQTSQLTSEINVDLRHALIAIAKALDYVGLDDLHHGHRVAYMAYKCAEKLGWSEDKKQFAYFAGLIHDCGVSQSTEHETLIRELKPQTVEEHCVRGYNSLIECDVLKRFAIPVRYHHTPWLELKELSLNQDQVDISAIIFLADRVDFFRAQYHSGCHDELIVLQEELIADCIRNYRGSLFNPEMADVMINLVLTDGFWFRMIPSNIEQLGISFKENDWYDQVLSIAEVKQLAQFLAQIVDAKSPFTKHHSEKVANLSRYMAEKFELDDITQDMIFIAGLMHDVGKLKTPDKILHKNDQLTKEEYSRLKRHSTDTEITLRTFFPNSIIADWAANHHERLDGSGYPNHLLESELDLPSRIIALVDVFQALSQERPYRGRLSVDEILNIMLPSVEENKLDRKVMEMLMSNLSECYDMSTSEL